MQSLNPEINALHAAFMAVTDRNILFTPGVERWWYDAVCCGVTADMVTEVMHARARREYSSATMRFHCLSLKHLIGDADRLAEFVDEAAALEATQRKRVFTPSKASVLEATGRPGEPDSPKVRHVSEVDWKSQCEGMRKAAP